MEKSIFTPRLELILQETAEVGSDDLRDAHTLLSDAGATLWSFTGPSQSVEETQKAVLKNHLPIVEHEDDVRRYRASYGVYLRVSSDVEEPQVKPRDPARFVGRVSAKECQTFGTPFPDSLTLSEAVVKSERVLKLDIGYAFLSTAMGKGYAPEAVTALIREYRGCRSFWSPPFDRVYFQAVTGEANTRSRRVLDKTGFKFKGIHSWDGPHVFIGGAMQPPEVCVYANDC